MATEKRKIIIKGISYKASEGDIRNLIVSAAGSDADQIQDICVPKNASGGLKYIALVLFHTPDTARKVERKLHRSKFQGRELSARLTHEGQTVAETSASGHPHVGGTSRRSSSGGGGGGGGATNPSSSPGSHPGKGKDKERRERARSSGAGHNKPSSSSSSRDKKDHDRDRDGDRARLHGKVIIADGSSKKKKAS